MMTATYTSAKINREAKCQIIVDFAVTLLLSNSVFDLLETH